MRCLLCLLLAFLIAGCSRDDEGPPLSFACTEKPQAVLRALDAAPGDVKLPDGTPLSECVARAETDAELQTVGLVLTSVAEDLEQADKALELGYLIGAARRGAPGESQVQTELVRRLERSGAAVKDVGALREGMQAGEEHG